MERRHAPLREHSRRSRKEGGAINWEEQGAEWEGYKGARDARSKSFCCWWFLHRLFVGRGLRGTSWCFGLVVHRLLEVEAFLWWTFSRRCLSPWAQSHEGCVRRTSSAAQSGGKCRREQSGHRGTSRVQVTCYGLAGPVRSSRSRVIKTQVVQPDLVCEGVFARVSFGLLNECWWRHVRK